jgi:alcohol dehydrogenase class IV
MNYWFNAPAVKAAVPLAGASFVKGLITNFNTANVFVGSNIFPEGKQLLPGPASWISQRCSRKRALVVTDKFAEQFALKVEKVFKDSGFFTQVWNGCVPEAPLGVVKTLAEAMKAFEPDLIVPVGGGSSIDTAKAAWIFYERPDITNFYMITPFFPLMLRKKAIMAAVPTTAGTASETTSATVVTDESEHRKIPVLNPELVPDYALLYPEFTMSMPPALTRGCGLDVLAHAIDGVLCAGTTDFSDAMGVKATELAWKWLPRAYQNGQDREARHRMIIASCMAGMCFSNSSIALTHSLGHALGAAFKVHHGVAVGLFLPYALRFYHPVTDKIAMIAKALDLPGGSKDECLENVLTGMRRFFKQIDAAWSIKELGVSRAEFDAKLDKMAFDAWEDPSTFSSPRPLGRDEFKRLYEYAYEGKDIDF